MLSTKTQQPNASVPEQPPKLTPHGTECATPLLIAADAMHTELLAQCEKLMDAEAGTKEADDLERLSKVVEVYEQARWPLE